MALIVPSSPSTILILRYVERKPNGSFQYRRRIPEALRRRYGGKRFFVRSLRRDESRIIDAASQLTVHLDALWQQLISDGSVATGVKKQVELNHELKMSPALGDFSFPTSSLSAAIRVISRHTPQTKCPDLTEALEIYLSMHSNGKDNKFVADNTRAVAKLIERAGNLPLDLYSRSHAEDYRDHSLGTQSSGTVRRRLRMICAIVNRTVKEKQLSIPNPFEGLGIAGECEDGTKRVPFDHGELKIIAATCRNLDDDIRHIIALQLDTGCRVAEIVGLRVEDVILTHSIPHVRIRPWGKVRTLKTAASQRDIPLVGEALWAAERAVGARSKATGMNPWLFPRYASDSDIKATHASNTLNKWLRSLEGVSGDKTTHCFRHAMRDRLRAAQVPHDIQEAIGGWGTRTIGQGYGNGYPLQVLAEHMLKIVLTAPKSE